MSALGDHARHAADVAWAKVKPLPSQAWTWLKTATAKLWAWLRAAPAAFWHWLKHMPAVWRWALSAVVVVVSGVLIFLANPNWDWARPTVSSIASGRLHRPVSINGHLRVHLFRLTPDATVTGLKIGQPAGGWAPKDNLAEVDSAFVRAELLPLFIGRIILPRVEITRPVVVLYQDAKGRANWDFSDGKKAAKPTKLPPIHNFIINDGRLTLTSDQRHLTFKGTVNAHERADAGRKAFQLTGDGSLNGRAFELEAAGGPLLNVRTDTPYPFDLAVRGGDTRITANGAVLHPFDLGRLSGAVSISGHDLADLYSLTGLAFPNTPPYRISAKVTRGGMVYDVNGIKGTVGSSDIQGDMKVDLTSGRPYLTGDLSSRVLDFKDLGRLFGATAANAPSAPKLTAAPQAPQSARRLLPDAPLDVQRVRGMDAKVRYRALSVRASPTMPLRQVSLGVKLDHGLLALDPIDFSFPQGRLQGTAQIDAREAVQKDSVDLRLTGLRVQDFAPKIGGSAPVEGVLDARLRADGTGSSVHRAASSANGRMTVVMPGGMIRQSFAELMGVDATKGLFQLLTKDPHQTPVRCAIADFAVKEGVLQAQSIVFDTGVVVVNGSGTINMNDEALKLKFKGKPKKFRLVRVNAPILVGGHLAQPTFGIDAGPAVVQGGLAVIFNSIIPFLGLDLAKDANCSALMAQAQAVGAPTTTHPAPKKAVADPVPES